MEANPSCASPREEELEDGEIFDDEPQQNARPPRRPRPCRPHRRARLPGPVIGSAAGPPRPPHPHPAFPCELRQAFESAPRSGFWERSHGALTGRFRFRAHRPQDWPARDWQQRFPENHRTDSPGRKPQKSVRAQARRNPPLSKSEPVDESFEDLLLKYKQIQLELECIRKEERAALEDEEPPVHRSAGGAAPQESVEEQQQQKSFQAFNIRPLRQKLLTPAERDALNCRAMQEQNTHTLENTQQNTHTLENTQQNTDKQEDTQQKMVDSAADDAVKDEDSESDLNISAVSDETPVVIRKKEDEDDVSELQLRLLALQSASRKWQQKEKQVLKESKEKMEKKTEKKMEKISTASAEKISPRGAERSRAARTPVEKSRPANRTRKPAHLTKQALRKQQLRTWKLQQEAQRQQQEQEEERRRREDEIRRIRDLSNQDEQYNRFMRLVGSRRPSRSKSTDSGKLKQSLDTSGCLYQYDNYDEVAMDTDSETNSPAASPTHDALPVFPLESTPHRQVQQGECVRVCAAPPLPPLPPPDEDEPPPKPPFADEEEEEEMLLREELLKSLANRRAPRAEGVSSISGPPSPSLRCAGQSRSNLSTVSLNTVISHTRALKFIRAHSTPKAPFVLPRHKAVVVRLNASDDSDSEAESCIAAQSVFGGLESMIKEARRTAEAAKPKRSVSEKENNPLKSAEAGADGKKLENRLLRDSVSSVDPLRSAGLDLLVASPAGSDSELELMSRAVELQDRLVQHRAQLSKDEALLKQLLLQEQKKKESLKAAEGKVLRLKEQLLASEKIVSANRVLLRKLQEQVHRVQHRVSVKQQQAVRMEKGLQQTQAPLKRRANTTVYSPLKRVCVGQSDVQYAELIAQKRRLQQLESEYALKIQKLKEVQALRQADPRPAAPPPPLPTALYPLPQPSLHDLTQDKLALSTGGEEEEQQTASAERPSARRRSFRESGSSTRPKLSPPEPPTLPTASSALADAPKLPCAAASAPADLPELLPGLTVEDLRRRYTLTAGVPELLKDPPTTEHHGKVLQVDFELPRPQSRVELKPEPFGVYHSPLLAFRSYRFSPYFRTKEKLSLRSLSFSNAIEPKKSFCRFDLTGTCNADDCTWQHMRNCTLSESLLFQDILSYCLPLIGCEDSSSASDISSATEKYMKKLLGANKDRMGTDQKAVLLVSKVNERLKHIPPFTTHKAQRRWRPEAQRLLKTLQEEEDQLTVGLTAPARHDAAVPDRRCWTDVCVTQDDKRYFDSETDDISNLETSVLENPTHTQLWIKLAFRYLSQRDSSVSECLDAALNTLSRALEDNAEHSELWSHYLTLFTRRASRHELQEMCEMAVEHAPHYSVWWTYLSVESGFVGKDFVAARLVSHLLDAPDLQPDLRSFQLLETLLFRAQLSVFSGRTRSATHTLKIALNSSAASRLTLPHRTLLWLSFIHLLELQCLPSSLFDPADSNPSRTVSTEPFLIPWRPAQDTHTPAEQLIQLFTDALSCCTDEGLSSDEQIQGCFPLHSNLIHLLQHLHRRDEALAQCERLLEVCPLYCPLLEVTAALQPDRAAELWMNTHSQHSTSAQLFYQLSRCLQTQGKLSVLEDLFGRFMLSLCQSVPEQIRPLDVLRHILGVPTDLRAPVLKEHLQEELKDQLPYLHLLHCLWQVVYGSVREAVDAFEKALGAVTKLELIHTLWLDYLSFSRQQVCSPQPSARELKVFSSLVLRCLQTVPVRLLVPFSSAQYWSSFSFHNQVVSFYLGCFPKSQHSLILEKLQHIMPTNTELAIRLLQQEWQEGNIEHFKLQSRMLCSSFPTCLAVWNIAIAVEKEQRQRSEVQRLYQQALQNMPLCAALWTDCLLFEAAEGGKTDTLKCIIERSQESGVSLQEVLGVCSPRSD